MSYEQVVHDQSLYCATQSLELAQQLSVLSRASESTERTRNAKQLMKKLNDNESRIAALRHIYRTVGREDLEHLLFELTNLTMEEHSTALSDPDGWKRALQIGGQADDGESYVAPTKELNQWRIKFIEAIQSK